MWYTPVRLIKLHRMLYTLLEHTKPISCRRAHVRFRIIIIIYNAFSDAAAEELFRKTRHKSPTPHPRQRALLLLSVLCVLLSLQSANSFGGLTDRPFERIRRIERKPADEVLILLYSIDVSDFNVYYLYLTHKIYYNDWITNRLAVKSLLLCYRILYLLRCIKSYPTALVILGRYVKHKKIPFQTPRGASSSQRFW